MGRGALVAFVPAAGLWVAAVAWRVIAARASGAWLLALFPFAALIVGPRSRGLVVFALVELAALVPLHGLVTLLRAARLEGG